ncbi:ATP-binding protein [Sphaerotilus microaerophilus]|uniref:YhaN AAA domain-containing protein n=1 Tax=Sphaerotilus microaerophilus TaxID=2914710 RepID=A0ABN6PML0_9BURK|nr:YhaN family protein [Sphaerotilus sp. FB-5]BDI05768.1 hypothetical protein CATMQ487_27380 [Sphaerotilus sp. FB-5]
MRLQTLELIRYGRFTDEKLVFPHSDCDFHLVVGPNEAGKSTLRRAVSELLFGMPLRSDMDFRHPLAELRLGAVIESAASTLAFHRARGRKPLRRPDDSVLADAALTEHLGGTTAGLFERMFCLDLAGLLKGGHSILDASDDVGQLLFQSAAGLSSLGALRDALAAEADSLYAPRKSGSRAFYAALDPYEAARQTLRGATVNTRAWSAAQGEVERLDAAYGEAGGRYRALSAQRQRLERIRRIAPRVAQLHDLQAQLAELAQVPLFPTEAAQRLADGEVTLATQTARLELLRQAEQALQVQRAALTVDAAVLAQAGAVEALAAQGQACSHHPRDIGRREEEVSTRLRDAAALAAQLGWPADEAALRARLPSPLALRALATLMQQRGALLQVRQSAEEGLQRTRTALERLQGQPGLQPQAGSAPVAAASIVADLAAALQEAQPLKAGAARQRALDTAMAQAGVQLDAALVALGAWRREPAALAALSLPSEERLTVLKAERARLMADADAARRQLTQAQEQARRSALALAQFTAATAQVVTLDDVQQARSARDQVWGGIKRQPADLAERAPELDHAIERADALVDRQRDQVDQSARLAGLRQDSARDEAAAAAARQQSDEAGRRLVDFDARWAEQAGAAGLPRMALLDLSGWLVHRRAALDAAATLDARRMEQVAQKQAEAQVTAALQQALRACVGELPGASAATGASGTTGTTGTLSLAALCSRAEQWLAAQQAERAQAEARAMQITQAQAELDHQAQRLHRGSAEVAQWEMRWQEAVKAASLEGPWMTPEAAADAVEQVDRVRELLAQADELRVQRIQTMRRDLADFDQAAQALRQTLGAPDEAGHGGTDPFAWARSLQERLRRAQEAKRESERLQAELQEHASALRSAETALAATHAALGPLYTLAQTPDPARLRTHIAASDRRRRLEAEAQQQRQAIVEAGDGLALDALLTEHAAAEPQALKADIEALDAQLGAEVEQQTRLAGELAQARAALARIHGGSEAAVAESKRLEALAQLGDTAERYLHVATGHRLLRWAVDRYRERRQGPLLQRASTLFAQLTLGRFARLTPDFEVTPPRLIALRPDGERVHIDGLSEGTRDQLFLALRLAALELHIASDRSLPFIADDLFVNFHDSRSRAGLAALGELARRTQVIFLTHHEHLVDVARECVGREINVVTLEPA